MSSDNIFCNLMNNKQVCASKWRWSTIHLQQATTRSCHHTNADKINLTNFNNFHNLPLKIKTRQSMLNGNWPGHGCEYCKNIESVGGKSDRMIFNQRSTLENIPVELFKNNKETAVTPTLIEVTFSNICNMSCIYCDATYSSVWEEEERRNGNDVSCGFVDKKTHYQLIEKFFKWLDKNLIYLKDIHVLGGEPTHQPEFYRLLDLLSTHSEVALNSFAIITNLKISPRKLENVCNLLDELMTKNSIEAVCVYASIDCWGQEQEYIRSGINIDQFEQNLLYILSKHSRIKVHLHGTMTLLTVPTMKQLIERINFYNKNRTENLVTYDWNFVNNCDFLHPGIMPNGFYDQYFDELTDITGNLIFQDYKNLCNSVQYNTDRIKELVNFLNMIDYRRYTSWKQVFPWLADFLETASI